MRSRLTRIQHTLDELEHRREEAGHTERWMRASGHEQVYGVWFGPSDFLSADATAELADIASRVHELMGQAAMNDGEAAEFQSAVLRWVELRDEAMAEAQHQIGSRLQPRHPGPTGDSRGLAARHTSKRGL